jgi:hypothetical protein
VGFYLAVNSHKLPHSKLWPQFPDEKQEFFSDFQVRSLWYHAAGPDSTLHN